MPCGNMEVLAFSTTDVFGAYFQKIMQKMSNTSKNAEVCKLQLYLTGHIF